MMLQTWFEYEIELVQLNQIEYMESSAHPDCSPENALTCSCLHLEWKIHLFPSDQLRCCSRHPVVIGHTLYLRNTCARRWGLGTSIVSPYLRSCIHEGAAVVTPWQVGLPGYFFFSSGCPVGRNDWKGCTKFNRYVLRRLISLHGSSVCFLCRLDSLQCFFHGLLSRCASVASGA